MYFVSPEKLNQSTKFLGYAFSLILLSLSIFSCSGPGDINRNQPTKEIKANGVPLGSQLKDLRFVDLLGNERRLTDLGRSAAVVLYFADLHDPQLDSELSYLDKLSKRSWQKDVHWLVVGAQPDSDPLLLANKKLNFARNCIFVRDPELTCSKALGVTHSSTVVILDNLDKIRFRSSLSAQDSKRSVIGKNSEIPLDRALFAVLTQRSLGVQYSETRGSQINDQVFPPIHRNRAEIDNIVANSCAPCHDKSPGSTDPVLRNHADLLRHGKAAAYSISSFEMPLRACVDSPAFKVIALKVGEREAILDFLEQEGIKADRPAAKPALPQQIAWKLGKPDQIIELQEEFYLHARTENLQFPQICKSDVWVRAIEVRVDSELDFEAVHLGFQEFGKVGNPAPVTGLFSHAAVDQFPDGAAFRIPAGSFPSLHMQLSAKGERQWLKSSKKTPVRVRIGLYFPSDEISAEVLAIGSTHSVKLKNGETQFSHDLSWRVDRNSIPLALHMNLPGEVWAAEVGLLDHANQLENWCSLVINRLDWQPWRKFTRESLLPAGSRVRLRLHFDTSLFYKGSFLQHLAAGRSPLKQVANFSNNTRSVEVSLILHTMVQLQNNIRVNSRSGEVTP